MLSDTKGQAVVIDLIVALIIFLIAFSFLASTYSSHAIRLEYETSYTTLMMKSFDITEMLTKSEGIPSDWNSSHVDSIGFAYSDRILSTDKLQRFTNISYNRSKELFRVVGKEYLLQIRDKDNVNLFEAGVSPLEGNPCGRDYVSVTLKRFAVWGGQNVIVHFTLWDDECTRNASGGKLIIGGVQEYSSSPAVAFEEDNDPSWTTQVQTNNDYQYAHAIDEDLIKPDYVQFDFPNLQIPSNKAIVNATFNVWHKEYLAGGTMPQADPNRHEVQCWNGNWISMGTYAINENNSTFVKHSADISSCITSISLANNINIRFTFDPTSNLGTQDIDYAEVIVNVA